MSTPPTRAPTLQDVARVSGVSAATVSRFRRGVQPVSTAVARRIEAAIDALGYRANLVARSMATGRTGVVGIVVLDLNNPHFTSLVRGAQQVARAQGRSLALVDTAESRAPERQLLEALARRVDGLVVSARLADDAVAWLSGVGKPVVCFGRLAQADLPSVRADGVRAAQLLGRHLIAGGHRRVDYLGFRGSRWSGERERALREVFGAAGLPLRAHAAAAPDAASGQALAAHVLFQADPPDAVIAYNDVIAMGFMHEAQRLGVAVPDQLSVAAFDDIDVARHLNPPLTTVSMHGQAQGELAMRRLLELVDRPAGPPPPTTHDVLWPHLQVRHSTRPLAPETP